MWSVTLEINLCPNFLFLFPRFFVIPWWWESKTPEISISNFMMLDIELGSVMVDCGLLTKFLTSLGKKMLYRIYTFMPVPRLLHEHSYAFVSVRKSCFHMRTQITIRPLWLVFEKPLPERAIGTLVIRMRHYSLLQFNWQLPTRALVSPFNWSVVS